jgi:hypothetical protein
VRTEAAVLAGGPRPLEFICEVAARNAAAVRDLLTAHGNALFGSNLPRRGM